MVRLSTAFVTALLPVILGLPNHADAQPANPACGSLSNSYGPYDYLRDRDKLPIVERFHFTASVENLTRGVTAPLGSELDYTLRAFPNHHRALLAIMRLGQRDKIERPNGMNYTIECYFYRALTFRSDDSVARLIYSIYLRNNGRLDESENQVDVTAEMTNGNPLTHFNAGRQYFELKKYDKAAKQAKTALELGWNSQELVKLLREAGKWPEAAPVSAPASSAAAH